MEHKPSQLTDKGTMPDASFDMGEIEQAVNIKVEQLKELPLISKAFELLDKLPSYLKYHNKQHTEDVFHEAVLFGILSGLSETELQKVATAAAWHDVGFLIQDNDNEEKAIELFERASSSFLNLEYKKDINVMIMDTKVHKTEKGLEIIMSNPISAHLLDADLSNFGRVDFWEKRKQIAEEMQVNLENENEKRRFLESTLNFIKNHDWHTEIARKLRQEQKMQNIAELEKEIAELG